MQLFSKQIKLEKVSFNDASEKTYSFAEIVTEINGDYSNSSKYIPTFFEDIGLRKEWEDLSYYNKSFSENDKRLLIKILNDEKGYLKRQKDRKTVKKQYVNPNIEFLISIINDIYSMFSSHIDCSSQRCNIYKVLSDYAKDMLMSEISIEQSLHNTKELIESYVEKEQGFSYYGCERRLGAMPFNVPYQIMNNQVPPEIQSLFMGNIIGFYEDNKGVHYGNKCIMNANIRIRKIVHTISTDENINKQVL